VNLKAKAGTYVDQVGNRYRHGFLFKVFVGSR